jgi:predicted nucleotidyltransferase/plasmid stabilization system protein ParE
VARTVRWTETATQDLAEAAEFIGRDSRFYAAALVRETWAVARSLRTFAERGRVVPEINAPDIREIFTRSYRLIYRVTADRVFILPSTVHRQGRCHGGGGYWSCLPHRNEGALDTGPTHGGGRRRTLFVIPLGGGKESDGIVVGFPVGPPQPQGLFGQGADFCRHYQVRELALFGSVLRQEHRPDSDVDLLVSFAPVARVTFLTLARMQRELEVLLGRKVDLVPKDRLKPIIREQILATARVLYVA